MNICDPIADDGFVYHFNGAELDIPDLTTAPVSEGGYIGAGTNFMLFWNNPSASTQNALNSATAGPMTFLAADGAVVLSTVAMSVTNNSGAYVASVTVLSLTPE